MDQSKVFSQARYIQKGEKYLSESSHEGEVAKKGENQRGNHGFRGGQVIIGCW